MGNLKIRLDNHIKSFQTLLHYNEKCMSHIKNLKRSIQSKKWKRSTIQVVLDSILEESKNVAQLKQEIFVLKNKKAHIKTLLDDYKVDINDHWYNLMLFLIKSSC